MEKKKFIVKWASWIAVAVAAVLLVLGLAKGSVIEESTFAEVAKWIVVGLGIIAIIEGLCLSTILPLAWHWKQKKAKDEPEKLD